MIRFLGAVQFLTVLPVRSSTCAPGEAAGYFPIVGGLLGLAAGGFHLLLTGYVAEPVNALLTVLLLIILSGALHEDGLADCADAFGGQRPPERVMAILKDSRIGAFGALALVFSVGLRWQAIAQTSSHLLESLAAAGALSRTSQVALAWISRPAGEGSGRLFALSLITPRAVVAILLAAVITIPLGVIALPALVGTAGLTLIARDFYERHLGGVNGDCCGALSQVVEGFILLLCASIW
ncbi:MAG: adenosylcobinamide-GDP ribazoletransferase [Bryobacteraceae bacterium]|nr:adenosylcobinamide-GDP ribazoletransferase [Bryobacteraceae bacterium]